MFPRIVFILHWVFAVLPAAALGAVGVTAGTASVSPSGAARYDVPLSLPHDRLAPTLALQYSHHRGDGLLGVGFAISGLSTIQRCNQTIAQDGSPEPPRLLHTDRYCLDGARLRLTSGSYGEAGSTYQTEVETFARATAFGSTQSGSWPGGPSHWEVWTRDGLIHEYGATGDARIESVGTSTPRVWALNRIRDRLGNYVDFTYIEDEVNGSYRPNTVTYSGNSLLGTAASTRIVFVYETATRPDPIFAYRYGDHSAPGQGIIVEYRRLDRIDVVHAPTSQVVHSYELTYESPGGTGGRTRLASIQQCAGSDCLAPVTFQWTNGTPGWLAEVTTSSPVATVNSSVLILDFDKDGQEDLLYPSSTVSGAGTWMLMRGTNNGYTAPVNTGAPNWNHADAQIIDWDGDGASDLLAPCSAGGNWCVFYERAGTPPNQTFAATPLDTGVAIVGNGTNAANEWIAVDVTGDQQTDLVHVVRVSPTAVNLYYRHRLPFNQGPPYFIANDILLGGNFPLTDFAQALAAKRRTHIRRVDMDGDGTEDPYFISGAFLTIVRSNGQSGFSTPSGASVYPGDFNGDGLTDLAYAGSNWVVHFSRGGGFANAYVGPAATNIVNALIVDYDSDGKSDVLMSTSTSPNWLISRSTGNGLTAFVDTGLSIGASAMAVAADVNGDGLHDLGRIDTSAANTWKFRLHAGSVPDLLDRVTDGYGNFADFDYRSTGLDNRSAGFDDRFYTPVDQLQSHQQPTSGGVSRPYNGPMILVERLSANDGIGGVFTMRHAYVGGVRDNYGRGFLGFIQHSIADSRDNSWTPEVYSVVFPHVGALTYKDMSVNGRLSYVQIYEYASIQLSSGQGDSRVLPYLASVQDERFEMTPTGVRLISITTTTNTVDSWGTLTDQTTTTEDGATSRRVKAPTRRSAHPYNWSRAIPPIIRSRNQRGISTASNEKCSRKSNC